MIIVIPCGAKKKNGKARAIDIYTGSYFRACKRYAMRHASLKDIFILSAKYGLIPSQKIIQSYDQKMTEPGHITIKEVYQQAK